MTPEEMLSRSADETDRLVREIRQSTVSILESLAVLATTMPSNSHYANDQIVNLSRTYVRQTQAFTAGDAQRKKIAR